MAIDRTKKDTRTFKTNKKATPVPVVPAQAQIVDSDGRVTRTGQLLLEQLQDVSGATGPAGPSGPPGAAGTDRTQAYWRTLDIADTATGDDIGPNLNVQGTGVGISITGILRKPITADLVVRVNVAGLELDTITIPHTTPTDHTISLDISTHTLVQGTPITFDITDSDASKDKNGIATITLLWGQPIETTTIMAMWMGPYDSSATYAKGDTVSFDGSSWISLVDSNTGNTPDSSPTDWDLIAEAGTPGAPGAAGAGVPTGGTAGQVLAKVSSTDYDDAWVSVGGGTVTHTGGALTADQPIFGAGSADVKVGTKTGNTDKVATATGTLPSGHLAMWDSSGNLVDAGPPGAYVPLTSKGDLVTYDTDVTRMAVGTNGQILAADSTVSKGIKWENNDENAITLSDVTTLNVSTSRHGFAPKAPADATRYLDGTGAWSIPTGSGGGLPLTTKGDLLTYGTALARLPVGSDGQVLTSDHTVTLGIKWTAAASGAGNQIQVNGTGVSDDYIITINSYVQFNSVQRWP